MDADPPAPSTPEPNPFEPPRTPGGKPIRRAYRPVSLVGKVAGGVAVLLSGLIAFVGTCFPLGFGAFAFGGEGNLAGFFLVMAWLIGAVVALLAAFGAFRLIFRSRQSEQTTDEVGRT